MANKFDNTNKVSLWKKVAKSGKEYFKGTVYVGSVAYDITLFSQDVEAESNKPVLTGSIELKTK